MKPYQRRLRAAFFLFFISLSAIGNPGYAALIPEGEPSNINLNSQSVRPVELRRDPEFTLPDISHIFEGYSVDELPTDIPIPTTAAPQIAASDDGLLILELRIGRAILNDAFIGYSTRNSVMLPIGALADALQLAIRIDPDIGQAEGWVIDENDPFKLDIRQQRVTIGGKVESVDRGRTAIRDNDIYVDMELLEAWLPIVFDFSFSEQLLIVSSRDGRLLPIEKLAKQQLARKDLKLRRSDQQADYPIIRAPYSLASLPFADLTATYDYDEQTNPRARTQGTLLSHGDLLYMNQRSFISYNEEAGLQDVRFTLSRTDPEGALFTGDDPLSKSWLGKQANDAGLTKLEIGDVFTNELALTMLSQDGRGLIVSNQPLNRADQFDRTNISGDVQPDYDVELYRNEELLAFQRSTATGRYEFNDVPLLSGLNIFRLVFYGPFGETREEIRRVLVNQNITKQGESYVRFMAMEQGKNLVDVNNTTNTNFSSSLFSGTENTAAIDTRGEQRYALEYEYGLADQLALYLQAAHVPVTPDITTNAATLGVAGVWKDVYGRIDISRSTDSGTAAQIITQTNLWGINLSLRHQEFDDFLSDFTEDPNNPVTRRSILRADHSLHLPILPRMSLGLAAAHTEFESGRIRNELNQRLTTTVFGRAALNHNLTFTQDDTPGATTGPIEITRGNMLVSVPAWGAFVRGGINYNITPDTELQNVSLTTDYSIDQDTLVRGEYLREFAPGKDTVIASLTRRFSSIALGVSAGLTSDGEAIAGLSLNTSFGFEPRSDKFRSYAEPVSRMGLISAKSFIDSNGNNVFDPNEEALERVDYLINNGPGSRRSQDKINGVQLLKAITPHEAVPISINPASLDNPFLVAGDSAVRVISRPGTPMVVNFPLKPAADIEGIVMLKQDDETREAANVLIEAVDANGVIVRSTRTAFDGIYLMELLPLGRYTLRVSPEQANKLAFDVLGEVKLEVTGKEEYIQDINFTIAR